MSPVHVFSVHGLVCNVSCAKQGSHGTSQSFCILKIGSVLSLLLDHSKVFGAWAGGLQEPGGSEKHTQMPL